MLRNLFYTLIFILHFTRPELYAQGNPVGQAQLQSCHRQGLQTICTIRARMSSWHPIRQNTSNYNILLSFKGKRVFVARRFLMGSIKSQKNGDRFATFLLSGNSSSMRALKIVAKKRLKLKVTMQKKPPAKAIPFEKMRRT